MNKKQLDLAQVRHDFPIFNAGVFGRPFIYLDSAATTQKPQPVINALTDYYATYCANVHRGQYHIAVQSTNAYEAARDKVARFIHAPDRRGVIFTKNCTESINLVAYSWARRQLTFGDEILTSGMEHHSNLVPWQLAAKDCGATLRFLPFKQNGEFDLSRLDECLTSKTRLVSLTGMSNVFGTDNDLRPVIEAAHTIGAKVLIDGAQMIMHRPVDVQQLAVDFFTFSGHKMLGPMGIGVLVAKPELLEEMAPFLSGGEMIRSVSLEEATWNDLPYKFEAGTPPIAEAIALGAAIDYLESLGLEGIREHEASLAIYGLKQLQSIPDLILYGEKDPQKRIPLFTFNLSDGNGGIIHPHDIETFVAAEGFAIRSGHHCAKPLMRFLGVPATCRVSCAFYNFPEEIQALAATLERARLFFMRR